MHAKLSAILAPQPVVNEPSLSVLLDAVSLESIDVETIDFDNMSELGDFVTSMEAIGNEIHRTLGSGGMTDAEVATLTEWTQAEFAKYPETQHLHVIPSMESFVDEYREEATTISMEGLKEVAVKAWKALLKLIDKAVSGFQKFWKKFFDKKTGVDAAIEQAMKNAKKSSIYDIQLEKTFSMPAAKILVVPGTNTISADSVKGQSEFVNASIEALKGFQAELMACSTNLIHFAALVEQKLSGNGGDTTIAEYISDISEHFKVTPKAAITAAEEVPLFKELSVRNFSSADVSDDDALLTNDWRKFGLVVEYKPVTDVEGDITLSGVHGFGALNSISEARKEIIFDDYSKAITGTYDSFKKMKVDPKQYADHDEAEDIAKAISLIRSVSMALIRNQQTLNGLAGKITDWRAVLLKAIEQGKA